MDRWTDGPTDRPSYSRVYVTKNAFLKWYSLTMIYHGKCATQHKHLMAYGVYHFLNLLGSSKCLLLLQLIYGRNHCSCLSCLSYRSYHLLRCNLSCATTTSSEATTAAPAFFLAVPAASFFSLRFFSQIFFLDFSSSNFF